jgi:hypothetical protein
MLQEGDGTYWKPKDDNACTVTLGQKDLGKGGQEEWMSGSEGVRDADAVMVVARACISAFFFSLSMMFNSSTHSLRLFT